MNWSAVSISPEGSRVSSAFCGIGLVCETCNSDPDISYTAKRLVSSTTSAEAALEEWGSSAKSRNCRGCFQTKLFSSETCSLPDRAPKLSNFATETIAGEKESAPAGSLLNADHPYVVRGGFGKRESHEDGRLGGNRARRNQMKTVALQRGSQRRFDSAGANRIERGIIFEIEFDRRGRTDGRRRFLRPADSRPHSMTSEAKAAPARERGSKLRERKLLQQMLFEQWN